MHLRDRLKFLRAMAVMVFAVMILSSITMASPHDRWEKSYYRGDKKARKFINGHDARDGRFDGRGPRRRFYRDDDRDRFFRGRSIRYDDRDRFFRRRFIRDGYRDRDHYYRRGYRR